MKFAVIIHFFRSPDLLVYVVCQLKNILILPGLDLSPTIKQFSKFLEASGFLVRYFLRLCQFLNHLAFILVLQSPEGAQHQQADRRAKLGPLRQLIKKSTSRFVLSKKKDNLPESCVLWMLLQSRPSCFQSFVFSFPRMVYRT